MTQREGLSVASSSRRSRRCSALRTTVRAVAALCVLVAISLGAPGVAGADDGEVTVRAVIDGQVVEHHGVNNPVVLGEERESEMIVRVLNESDADIQVRRVRLEGKALGVTFVAYDTVMPATVPAGSEQVLDITLPLDELPDQAVGLIPSAVAVLDDEGDRIADQRFVVDVRGTITSTFGVFGLVVAAVATLSLTINVWLITRRRLPPNRWARGLRFAVTGVGLGMTVAFTFAAARLLPPYQGVWQVLVGLPALAGFLLGYISPGPLVIERDPIDEALEAFEAEQQRRAAARTTQVPESIDLRSPDDRHGEGLVESSGGDTR